MTKARRLPLGRIGAISLVALFLALLVYGVTTTATDTTIDDALSKGETPPAPALGLEPLDLGDVPGPLRERLERAASDGEVSTGELRGTPVVLNYWASWCDPCREEAPVLSEAWKEVRDEGVLFLGVDVQDLTRDARDFAREFGLSFAHLRDPRKEAANEWGTTGIPETFFVSPEGRVVGHVVGAISAEQLRDGIAAARAGRPLGALSGGDRRPTP